MQKYSTTIPVFFCPMLRKENLCCWRICFLHHWKCFWKFSSWCFQPIWKSCLSTCYTFLHVNPNTIQGEIIFFTSHADLLVNNRVRLTRMNTWSTHLRHEKKPYYFPLNPGWWKWDLCNGFHTIPIYLGSIIPYITQPTRVLFIAHLGNPRFHPNPQRFHPPIFELSAPRNTRSRGTTVRRKIKMKMALP